LKFLYRYFIIYISLRVLTSTRTMSCSIFSFNGK